MKLRDVAPLSALGLLALFIWCRNTSWMSTADDTLPILVTLPLFYFLGQPWSWRKEPKTMSPKHLIGGAVLMLCGVASELTFLMGAGWSMLLWAYLSSKVSSEALPRLRKLMILPIMAFPWIALDASTLGWYFRLSGASVAEWLFATTGFQVVREGTGLFINNLPVSVEPACSGLNTLQSMLIAGSVGAYIVLENSSRYWWNLPFLAVMAWLSNTIRIIILILAALIVSPEFALGPFHDFGGWLVIVIMFLMCWTVFNLQVPKKANEELV